MNEFLKIEYKGGHPLLPKPCNIDIYIYKHRRSIEIKEHGFFATIKFNVSMDDIIDISFEEKSNRSVGKAAAGAIIGGVLTGGIGLLAGAALGARKKNSSMLYLTVEYKEKNFVMILQAGKQADNIYSAINGLWA
jgi:hypothetical protein